MKNTNLKYKKNHHGFSLVELLVVIAVIGVIASIAIPSIGSINTAAKTAAAQRNAQPFVYPTGLVEIPMSPISDIGAFRGGRWRLDWFLTAIRQALAWCIDNRAVFDFLCHPSCMYVVDPEFRTVGMICDMVRRAGDRAAIITLDRIAARYRPAG